MLKSKELTFMGAQVKSSFMKVLIIQLMNLAVMSGLFLYKIFAWKEMYNGYGNIEFRALLWEMPLEISFFAAIIVSMLMVCFGMIKQERNKKAMKNIAMLPERVVLVRWIYSAAVVLMSVMLHVLMLFLMLYIYRIMTSGNTGSITDIKMTFFYMEYLYNISTYPSVISCIITMVSAAILGIVPVIISFILRRKEKIYFTAPVVILAAFAVVALSDSTVFRIIAIIVEVIFAGMALWEMTEEYKYAEEESEDLKKEAEAPEIEKTENVKAKRRNITALAVFCMIAIAMISCVIRESAAVENYKKESDIILYEGNPECLSDIVIKTTVSDCYITEDTQSMDAYYAHNENCSNVFELNQYFEIENDVMRYWEVLKEAEIKDEAEDKYSSIDCIINENSNSESYDLYNTYSDALLCKDILTVWGEVSEEQLSKFLEDYKYIELEKVKLNGSEYVCIPTFWGWQYGDWLDLEYLLKEDSDISYTVKTGIYAYNKSGELESVLPVESSLKNNVIVYDMIECEKDNTLILLCTKNNDFVAYIYDTENGETKEVCLWQSDNVITSFRYDVEDSMVTFYLTNDEKAHMTSVALASEPEIVYNYDITGELYEVLFKVADYNTSSVAVASDVLLDGDMAYICWVERKTMQSNVLYITVLDKGNVIYQNDEYYSSMNRNNIRIIEDIEISYK